MAATNHSPAYDLFGYSPSIADAFVSVLQRADAAALDKALSHKRTTPLERDLFRKARAILHDVPGVAEAWIEKECVELDYGAMTDRERGLAGLVDTVAGVCWCNPGPTGQPGAIWALVAETEAQQRA